MQLRNENRGIFCILYGNAEVHTSIIAGHGQRQADHVCRPGGFQHPDAIAGKRFLLIDDIITTGATVSACALALQQAGAYEITAAAVAATEELPKSLQKSTEKRK